MYSEVDKDSLRALHDEAEADYQRNKDWRVLCDRYMKMREDGDKRACPNIVEEGFIERSISEEYLEWQERGDALIQDEEHTVMLRSKLQGWNYDPDTTRFEDLPYHMNQETPDRGSVPELEDAQTKARENHDADLQSLYADMYARHAVLPYTAKTAVPGYEEYAKERMQERVEEITAKHIGRVSSFNSDIFGIDYSRSSAEPVKQVDKILDKTVGVEVSKPTKLSSSSVSKNRHGASPILSKQFNRVKHGVSNSDYDFDEFDDDDDTDFER